MLRSYIPGRPAGRPYISLRPFSTFALSFENTRCGDQSDRSDCPVPAYRRKPVSRLILTENDLDSRPDRVRGRLCAEMTSGGSQLFSFLEGERKLMNHFVSSNSSELCELRASVVHSFFELGELGASAVETFSHVRASERFLIADYAGTGFRSTRGSRIGRLSSAAIPANRASAHHIPS